MTKLSPIITDIVHTAMQAALTDDEQIQRQGLADIYDAIASVLHLDHRAAKPAEASTDEPPAVSGCPSLGPKVFPSGADGTEPADGVYRTPEKIAAFCQSEMQREEARRLRKIVWRTYASKVDLAVMGKTRQNGKVYEVRVVKRTADVSDTYAQPKVNGKIVLTGSFTGSAWMAKRMMTAAAQALVNHKAKRNRDSRRNHKAKRNRDSRRNHKKRDAAKDAENQALIDLDPNLSKWNVARHRCADTPLNSQLTTLNS